MSEAACHRLRPDDQALEQLRGRCRRGSAVDDEPAPAGRPTPPASRPARARAPAASRSASSRRAPARGRPPTGTREARTGFRLWGIVDEPPASADGFDGLLDLGLAQERDVARDLAQRSARHAERARERRRADRDARARARRAPEGRGARPAAKRRSSPSAPSDASVPEAPPNCRTAAPASADSMPSIVRASASSQPAAFRPNVMGVACCSQVRPGIGVRACWRACVAAADAARRRSRTTIGTASRSWRTSPVSMMSWLVAPQCTYRLDSGSVVRDEPGERLDQRNGEIAGRVGVGDEGRRGRSGRRGQRARSPRAADAGMIPACASARASAASTSSIFWTRVSSANARSTSVIKPAPPFPLHVEEHRLAGPLQHDVERVPVRACEARDRASRADSPARAPEWDRRRSPARPRSRSGWPVASGCPAPDADQQVRRLQAAVRSGDASRHDGRET